MPKERRCIVCQKDISDRPNRCTRCLECQALERKRQKSEYVKNHPKQKHGAFYFRPDGSLTHKSSNKSKECEYLDRFCNEAPLQDLPPMVSIRRHRIKEATDYSRIMELRREIKIITDWHSWRIKQPEHIKEKQSEIELERKIREQGGSDKIEESRNNLATYEEEEESF